MSAPEKKNLQLVKVYVRERPLTKDEVELKCANIIHTMTCQEISIKSGAQEKKYSFDAVFSMSTPQVEVYNTVVHPLIDYVLSGYTCTVFAYGQTGTGKTYTMVGEYVAPNIDFVNDPSVGMVPRSAVHLFDALAKLNLEYAVTVSFVEIYNEEIRDLLVSEGVPLKVYDDPENKGATCIKGVTEYTVRDTTEVYDLLNIGTAERQTASTNLNRNSSRSHTIFTIVVNTREITSQGEAITKTGKLHLIDLAGSENIGRSGATEMRAREAGNINKSLLTLGKVIKALALKMQHIPYRESKLTRILQDSLGGKSKTCMIATFSAALDCFEETASTLDYAHMARSVANCPTVNINRNQTTVMKEAHDELAKLRLELNAARDGEGFYMHTASFDKMTQEIRAKNERYAHLLREIHHLEEYIRSKQQRYDELNEAFERSRKDKEAATKELEETEEQLKQNEWIANYLDGRKLVMKDTASELLGVCKTSTKNEEIYHKKYEKQINSTLHNANVGRNIHSVASHYLSSIENISDVHAGGQEARLTDARKLVEALQENHAAGLKGMNSLLEEMKAKSESHHLTFDDIFKDKSYSAEQLRSQFPALFEDSGEVQLQRVREVKKAVQTVLDHVHQTGADMTREMMEHEGAIKKHFVQEKENTTNTRNLLQDLYSNMMEELNHLKQRRVEIKKNKELYMLLLEKVKKEHEESTKELATIRKAKKLIDEIRLHLRENSVKPLQDLNESVERFNTSLEMMRLLPSVVQKCRDNVAVIVDTSLEEIISNEKKAQDYSSNFFEASAVNVKRITSDMSDTLVDWSKRMENIHSSLTRTTIENCDQVSGQIETLFNAAVEYERNLQEIIQKSSENIKNMEREVEVNIHEGDTPVKPQYKYPSTIEADLSDESLKRQLKLLSKDWPLKY